MTLVTDLFSVKVTQAVHFMPHFQKKDFFQKAHLLQVHIDNGILPGHVDKDAAPGIGERLNTPGHGLL